MIQLKSSKDVYRRTSQIIAYLGANYTFGKSSVNNLGLWCHYPYTGKCQSEQGKYNKQIVNDH